MGRKNRPREEPGTSAGDKPAVWRTLLQEGAKVVASAIVGGVVALTSPVRELVYDHLWTRPPKLTLIYPRGAVHVDDRVEVGVVIEPVFPGVVPPGRVTLSASGGLERPIDATLAVVGGARVTILPGAGSRIEFVAREVGSHTLTATFESPGRPNAATSSSTKVSIAPPSDRKFASADYLAGTWQLKLGGNVYTMALTEPKRKTVAGTVDMNGSTWRIDGSHDGGTLWLYLYDPASPLVRLFLDGRTSQEGNYIKASGAIINQQYEKGLWADKIAKGVAPKTFEANTPTGP